MKDDLYLPVRLSHLLRHCSVGAIVRGPDYLLTVKDIHHWTDKSGLVAGDEITYVEQVKSSLGITQVLRKPPVAQQRDNGQVEGSCVPAMRFPSWMICPSCGLLHNRPWRDLSEGEAPRCHETDTKRCQKRQRLEQVPWVLIHEDGYMADVPWHYLTHSNKVTNEQKQCRHDWSDAYLRLVKNDGRKPILRCERCKASSQFDERIPINYSDTRQQPWMKEPSNNPDKPAVILEINDARVHSPINKNALVIPPESRIRKGSVVDRLYSNSQMRKNLALAKTPLGIKSEKQKIARELRCTVKEVDDALGDIDRGYPLYGAEFTTGLLLESEYQALMDELPDMAEDEDFVTSHFAKEWKTLAETLGANSKSAQIVEVIDKVVSVNRLKEILVMTGFQRLGGEIVSPDINGSSDWLPCLELYGEGIFLSFNEEIMDAWESNPVVRARADQIALRFSNTGLKFDVEVTISPRFILLHSLAHMVIRQLESMAGYPAASLKERIYSSQGGECPMAGILIYVAVPDVVGSLGGLAELADPQRFLRLMTSVFEHAEWCSIDPVCAEHEGQGPFLLNRAACHACSLIPEPSCSFKNVLLDRVFIKGDPSHEMPSFLDFQR